MPGVNIKTETRTGPIGAGGPLSGRFIVSGLTERGRVDAPQLIRSMAEYDALLGGPTTYGSVYDALRVYFEEGGAEAVVQRVVGAAAAVGTLTLQDRAGTPAATVRVDAASPGAWSTGISVAVTDGTVANTATLTVAYKGTPVEVFANAATVEELVQAASKSVWVRLTNLGSASVAPANLPKTLVATPLSAGSDDRASVTAAMVAEALEKVGVEWGPGAVACPGYTSTQVGAALMQHAVARRRVALLAGGKDDTVAQIKTAATALLSPTSGDYATLLYPWVKVPDGIGTKAVSPEGYAAAARSRAHSEPGPWRIPAGEVAAARYVVEPYVAIDRATGDGLDQANVSAIRTIAGTVRLYGWRSLSTDALNYKYLNARDVLNALAYECELALEPFIFETVDARGQLLGRVESTLVGILDPIRAAGGLFARFVGDDEVDPGYSVDVSEALNPSSTLAENKLNASIAVRLSPTAALIEVKIVKAGLNAAV